MLVAFKAISYVEAKRFACSQPLSTTTGLAQNYGRIWIISVTEPIEEHCPPIYTSEMQDVLPLKFEDIDADDWRKHGIEFVDLKSGPIRVFTPEQARKVCEFIRRAHSEPGHDLLVVNCIAGVSRSGAIVEFARQVCGASYDLFKSMNSHIVPNAFVGKLLREAWEMLDA